MRSWLHILAIPILTGLMLAAQSRTPVPEQSPRKALLEMLLGGDDAFRKHLTLEVQHKLGQTLPGSSPTGTNPILLPNLTKISGAENLETYEAGPVLLSYENGAQHQKLEIRIDGDDLRGAEDQMRLSFHSYRNGVEEELPAALRVTLAWKVQQNIWRLNAITVSATVPVGDAKIFDQSRWNLPALGPSSAASANSVPAADVRRPTLVEPAAETPAAQASTRIEPPEPVKSTPPAQPLPAKTADVDPQKISPARAIRLIGLAEDIYAQQHPATGFTCFLSELVNVGRGFEDGERYKFIDPELAEGVYNGYRFMVTACSGSPVKSYQVVAEPISGTGRAYCSNPTHELHGSDDGHAASCLASGKLVRR